MNRLRLVPRDPRVSGTMMRFTFRHTDICDLTALALHFDILGRASLADETRNLADRVKSAFASDGVVIGSRFHLDDYARLMSRTSYARQISEGFEFRIRDLARRIFCGLTGEEVCPIRTAGTR